MMDTAAHDDGLGEALFALASIGVRLRERELSLTAASTLSTLERTGRRRLTDLALAEGVTQPSMTSVVNQLEALGLAERRRDPTDRRVVLVCIAPAGRQYLRRVRRAGASALSVLMDKLSDDDLRMLRGALPALRRLADLPVDLRTGTGLPGGTTGSRRDPRGRVGGDRGRSEEPG